MLNLEAETAAVFACIGGAYGVSREELVSKNRMKPMGEARAVGYLLARRRGMSYPRIALIFGNRDHTTVMSGVRKAERLLQKDATLAALVVRFCLERNEFDGQQLLALAGHSSGEPVVAREGSEVSEP